MALVEFTKGTDWPDNYSVTALDNSWSVIKKSIKGRAF